jgi:PUA domain protein
MSIYVKKRHRLRKKEIKAISQQLHEIFLKECISMDDTVDRAELGHFAIILVNGDILGLIIQENPFLTVKGLLRYRPEKKYVTVDMGAVKYIYNGADVMAPGIVDADADISVGELIWVRDEKNLQPLAVGLALVPGKDMIISDKGKAIKSIHHVGDELWNYKK